MYWCKTTFNNLKTTLFTACRREGGRAEQRPGDSPADGVLAIMHQRVITHPDIASLVDPLFRKRERGLTITSLLVLLIITSFLPSCKPDVAQNDTVFFDLKDYFHTDSLRLTKLNHLTLKTVTHNGITETKKVQIANWGAELSLFSQSDINKPAWRNSYNIINDGNVIIYRAKEPQLRTREIVINKQGNKVRWILIYNDSKNRLYQTTEKLSYFPDSVYIIQKYQKVRLLEANMYVVKGSLN
jgi:hypothetical protein